MDNNQNGGAQAVENGLNYEGLLDLNAEYNIIQRNNNYSIIEFNNHPGIQFINGTKHQFMNYLINSENQEIPRHRGTYLPDDWYISEENNKIFIIETKTQKTKGSKDEVIQTAIQKKLNYSERYHNYDVYYIYLLNPWFRDNCPSEIRSLTRDNNEHPPLYSYEIAGHIPHFFGDDADIRNRIINFIINNL